MPYSTPPTLAAYDATPCLRLVKHGRAVLHATSSFVDGAFPNTWEEATLVLPILAAPEGQVHTPQFAIELDVSPFRTVDMCTGCSAVIDFFRELSAQVQPTHKSFDRKRRSI